jgi:Carboxypeptidase regulatory-like domain
MLYKHSANYRHKRGKAEMQIIKPRHFRKFVFSFLAVFLFCAAAAAQSGGSFTIVQSVIAGGGNTNSGGGQFSVSGTTGQPAAGQKATGAAFSAHAGFWNPAQFIPTAATVSISGRVMTANGSGIRNCLVTLTDSGGQLRTVNTAAFGYFRFTDVEIGNTYILTVSSKKYQFDMPSQILTVKDEISEILVIAQN